MSSKLLPLLLCASLGLACQAAKEGGSAGAEAQATASGEADATSAASKPAATARSERAGGAQAATKPTGGPADAAPEAASAVAAQKPAPVVVPAGTALKLELASSLSSATSHTGDLVIARLTSPVRLQDRVVLPEGTELRGHVTAAVPSGRVKGRARLAVAFEKVVLAGREHAVEVSGLDITADSSKKRDAAIIGGSAGAGAIIGAIAKGGKGAAVGAAVGGAAGTGAVLATKGKEVELPAGTPIESQLQAELRLSGS